MQKIKIASIEVKEGANERGPWKSYLIQGEDKAKFSTFDPSASVLKVGDMLEAEIEVKGKYTNLKSFTVTGHTELPNEKPAGAYHDDREDRTDVRTAVMQTAGLWTAGKLTDKDPEVIGLRKWLMEHLPAVGIQQPQQTVQKPKAVAETKKSPDSPPADSPFPVDEMLQRICEKKKFGNPDTARRWIINQKFATAEQIDTDPDGVWILVKAKQGWD